MQGCLYERVSAVQGSHIDLGALPCQTGGLAHQRCTLVNLVLACCCRWTTMGPKSSPGPCLSKAAHPCDDAMVGLPCIRHSVCDSPALLIPAPGPPWPSCGWPCPDLTWLAGKEGSVSSLFIACGWEAESGIPQLEEVGLRRMLRSHHIPRK